MLYVFRFYFIRLQIFKLLDIFWTLLHMVHLLFGFDLRKFGAFLPQNV